MNTENETRPAYYGAWAHNDCTKCGAKPNETCVWTGIPNELFPEPAGTLRPPHAARKFYYTPTD